MQTSFSTADFEPEIAKQKEILLEKMRRRLAEVEALDPHEVSKIASLAIQEVMLGRSDVVGWLTREGKIRESGSLVVIDVVFDGPYPSPAPVSNKYNNTYGKTLCISGIHKSSATL